MAHFKYPLPLSYTMYSQSATPQYPFDFTLQEKSQSQSFSLSDDDLQHLYLNNNDHRSTRLPQGPLLDRSRSIPQSMMASEPSPSFAPSSMGSVPMTTSYSLSPPSTGMPEEPLPLTPYTQLPSLFPTTADATLSPTNFASQQMATQHDTMFASQLPDTFASQSHQQYYFSSPDMSSNLPSAFNPMSAPADLSSGHALLHSDPSLLGAFGFGNHALGLKMEDDDEMGVRSQHSQSLSPHMFGISGPLRTPSGVLGEDESQFSMEMDEDGMSGGSPATLYPRPSPLTHSTSASQLDTRTIRVSRVPGSSQMAVYNAEGQLIPCPSSAPPLSSMFPHSDTSSVFGDRSLQESPSPTLGSVSAVDRRRPRRASHHHVDDAEYIDSSSPRRPRMRTAISVPSSLPNRPSRTGLSTASTSGLPAVGPNEMVITASIPVRRGRANTLFGGRAPRSVVPTPVPNLTKKSRGRRVPVARPLDLEEITTQSLGSDGNPSVLLPTRRSSRVSATPTSATDKENDGDEGLSAEDDDDDEFTSPSGSKPKSGKSKMSPRMQALVDEAIARGCSTTASGKARIFTCPVGSCLKCFARGEHLKRHVRSIHTEEKPYECDHPGCGKKFSRHDNLKQHKRVHKDKVGGSGSAGPKVDMGLLQFDLEPMDDE